MSRLGIRSLAISDISVQNRQSTRDESFYTNNFGVPCGYGEVGAGRIEPWGEVKSDGLVSKSCLWFFGPCVLDLLEGFGIVDIIASNSHRNETC